jgi:hypothetical protein
VNGDTSAAGVPCAPGSANCLPIDLPRHLYHPLNYNYQGGEELRLLNFFYEGGPFAVPGDLVLSPDPPPPDFAAACTDPVTGPLPVYRYTPRAIEVLPGIERLEDDEAAIDYNSPQLSDFVKYATPGNPTGEVCIRTLEFIFSPGPGPGMTTDFGIPQERIAEGVCLCGGDPGEPGFGTDIATSPTGFGFVNDLAAAYSTPAVLGKFSPGSIPQIGGELGARTVVPADILTSADRLYDPARGGDIEPMDNVTGEGGMRKPSLRKPEFGGTPAVPNYLWNSGTALFERALEEAIAEGLTDNAAIAEAEEEAAAFLAPSNENDYIRNREAATVLGKTIFWDQQMGSDSVQSCGSCHFHAGVDNRTKNQLNPNHLSGDFTFQIKGPNQEVTPADFPFHKLASVDIPATRHASSPW